MIQLCRECDKPFHVKRYDKRTVCDRCKDAPPPPPKVCARCHPRVAEIMGAAATIEPCDKHAGMRSA